MDNKQTDNSDARYAETLANTQRESPSAPDGFTKEQHDVAVAAVVLKSDVLNERQLSRALASWSIHGSVALADHLQQLKLLSESQARRFCETAREKLASDAEDIDQHRSAGKSAILGTLDAFDSSGTVARLLGIRGVAGAGASDATGNRRASTRFRLVRKLGQGGLGRVWLAFDESLKRHVAVKEITAKDNEAALERFRREAEITGRLEHPGIVPIYQLGEDVETSEVFYVMRFLGKTTMHDAIAEYHERRNDGDDDPMLIRRLLTDFVSICQAIGHAHSRKVIHRDLKPENIAIDSFGQVIVIDWGIAKVIDDVGSGEQPSVAPPTITGDGSTLEGQVLGTPLYMAPEQAAGRIDELDERTDIYGLGAILFAILTGYAPHERTREEAGASSGRQLLAAIASRPAPRAREANSDVDPALAAICAKAMARRQYARYESASQLADEVQRWMAGEHVAAYREKPLQRIGRWVAHHRIWSQVIAAAIIVGIVGLATFAVASRQSRIAARQVLFDEMRGFEREIEVQSQATAEELAKDARFMSALPPIQGIISARNGADQTEGEDVWRGRLETIFAGLLRANPNYLSISFVAVADEEQPQSIVQVERNLSDASYVRRVPLSRLGPYPHADVFSSTSTLPPGEIYLALSENASSATGRKSLGLVAATPVYDDTDGELFGIVALESNLLDRLEDLVETIDQQQAVIYITDAAGDPVLRDDPQLGIDLYPSHFRLDGDAINVLSQAEDHLHINRSAGWLAKRIELDPANPQATIGIILQLSD